MKSAARIKKLTALFLAACLLSGCGAKAPQEAADLPTPSPEAQALESAVPAASIEGAVSPTPEPVKTITWSDGVHADTDFDDMNWEVGDLTEFRALADRLSNTTDSEEAGEIYHQMLEEYASLRTDSELAWIELYSSDDADGSVAAACQQIDELLTDAWDVLLTAASAALKGDAGEEFTSCVGEEVAEELADYESMTDREAELWAKETELELRYNELEDRSDLGAAELNRRMGEIFLELIRVRNELAELYEYDSYAAYAYESVYGRDYTPEDAAALCAAVKEYARRFYRDCYYTDALYEEYGAFSPGELMDLLREYAPRISPDAAHAQQYMERHGLYILESVERVTGVGFTTILPRYKAPFLFNALYGIAYDVGSTFHEFGHYYDAFLNQEPDGVGNYGSYDIFEIHSTAMEGLLYGWYDEIFGADADYARINCLYGLVDNVISGCIFDEFLQYVYAHPELTVEGINQAYRDIASSYGEPFYRPSDSYYWMYVKHNFTSPFYYISYAVSTLASLQIWAMAEDDREGAVSLYNDLVPKGAYEPGYFELMDQMGLLRFTDDLDGCFRRAYETLDELCLRYDRGELAA